MDRRYEKNKVLEEIVFSKIFNYVHTKYTMCHEDDYLDQLSNIDHALEIILQIKYNTFFTDNNIPNDLIESFFCFQTKTRKIMHKDVQLVFFKYLFSRWIENVFYAIRYLDYNKATESFNKDDVTYKKIMKRVKGHSHLENIDNADKYYEDFFEKNKAIIEKYNWVICDRCDSMEEMIAKSQKKLYNPYTYLKEYYLSFRSRLDFT